VTGSVTGPIVRSDRNLWRAGDFGVVVLGPRASQPVTLDGTGAAVWDALERPCSRAELVDLLARTYRTDPTRIADDVDRLLTELMQLGIVEVAA
jgi:hypothetical protein